VNKLPLVVINSPTATGKTKLAIELAQAFGAEIISADSLQVYRYLDIGTAKPSLEDQKKVVHHLIDVVDPDEEFNASLFVQIARMVIAQLAEQKKPIFVVGGTGLYIRTLLQGIIETPQVDENLRDYYRQIREKKGSEYLHELLLVRDEKSALRINPRDSVRIIRALEVLDQTGQSITALQKKHSFADSPYLACKIGLKLDRKELKRRIDQRVDEMLAQGFLEEVQGLIKRGYGSDLKPMQSLGYRQIIDYLEGGQSWEKTVLSIKRKTWLYAKRQMTWFEADKEINWHSPEARGEIFKKVEMFFKINSARGCNRNIS